MPNFLVVDTETTGLDIFKGAKPFYYIFGYEEENGEFVVDASYDLSDTYKAWLEDISLPKVFHNAKFDILMLHSVGVTVKGQIYDTMIASHLIDENQSKSLANCSLRYLGEEDRKASIVDEYFKSQKIKKADRRYDSLPPDILESYAKQDVVATYKLWQIFEPQLKQEDLWDLFIRECNLVYVLKYIQLQGVKVDIDYLKELKDYFESEISAVEQAIYKEAGQKFDILSNKQLANILLASGANLPATSRGNYSVSEESLNSIKHPLVDLILKYRGLNKKLSTYVEGLLTSQTDGYIHANFNGQGAATGRMSCSAPNLQNIERDDKIIRSAFLAPDDYYMFFFDYSQQEYKVFLDYVQEEHYIEQVNQGLDFHTLVYNELKPLIKSRTQTKTLNFMLIYGGGTQKLADMLGISFAEANSIKEAYFARFSKVKPFFRLVDTQIKLKGYVRNRFKRKRRLESKFSYQGVNSLIQGSCADYVKFIMLRLYALLRKYKSKMILQIHDELVFYIHKDELFLVEQIRAVMEASDQWFTTKLTTETSWSPDNWARKRKLRHNNLDVISRYNRFVQHIQNGA